MPDEIIRNIFGTVPTGSDVITIALLVEDSSVSENVTELRIASRSEIRRIKRAWRKLGG
jgi:hypothetical protein